MDGSDLSLPICSILVFPVPDGSWSCLPIDARVFVISSNLLKFCPSIALSGMLNQSRSQFSSFGVFRSYFHSLERNVNSALIFDQTG